MALHYIPQGFQKARSRPGLAVVLYAANLILGLVISIPIFVVLANATAESGFSPELAQEFDVALWADMLSSSGPVLQSVMTQMIWILPLLFVWKVASSAGLVHALSGSENRFLDGVGRYTGKAILLGLLYLAPTLVLIIGVILIGLVLGSLLTGEVGSFWVQFVFTPLALVLGLAIIDMMHDFGRMELILGKQGVVDSWFAGLKWPLHSGSANFVYIVWMLVGFVLLLLPFSLNLAAAGFLLGFILQQLLLYARAMITVSWIGSEVDIFGDEGTFPEEPADQSYEA